MQFIFYSLIPQPSLATMVWNGWCNLLLYACLAVLSLFQQRVQRTPAMGSCVVQYSTVRTSHPLLYNGPRRHVRFVVLGIGYLQRIIIIIVVFVRVFRNGLRQFPQPWWL